MAKDDLFGETKTKTKDSHFRENPTVQMNFLSKKKVLEKFEIIVKSPDYSPHFTL